VRCPVNAYIVVQGGLAPAKVQVQMSFGSRVHEAGRRGAGESTHDVRRGRAFFPRLAMRRSRSSSTSSSPPAGQPGVL